MNTVAGGFKLLVPLSVGERSYDMRLTHFLLVADSLAIMVDMSTKNPHRFYSMRVCDVAIWFTMPSEHSGIGPKNSPNQDPPAQALLP